MIPKYEGNIEKDDAAYLHTENHSEVLPLSTTGLEAHIYIR
jgi:hypothetical protein